MEQNSYSSVLSLVKVSLIKLISIIKSHKGQHGFYIIFQFSEERFIITSDKFSSKNHIIYI